MMLRFCWSRERATYCILSARRSSSNFLVNCSNFSSRNTSPNALAAFGSTCLTSPANSLRVFSLCESANVSFDRRSMSAGLRRSCGVVIQPAPNRGLWCCYPSSQRPVPMRWFHFHLVDALALWTVRVFVCLRPLSRYLGKMHRVAPVVLALIPDHVEDGLARGALWLEDRTIGHQIGRPRTACGPLFSSVMWFLSNLNFEADEPPPYSMYIGGLRNWPSSIRRRSRSAVSTPFGFRNSPAMILSYISPGPPGAIPMPPIGPPVGDGRPAGGAPPGPGVVAGTGNGCLEASGAAGFARPFSIEITRESVPNSLE